VNKALPAPSCTAAATGPAGLVEPLLYLASQSPRRSQLLHQLGLPHALLLPDAHEDAEALELPLKGEHPLHYVQRVTQAKLDAACARLESRGWPLRPVLCADTTVFLRRRILGKPAHAQEALETLRFLAGKTHQVATAVAVAHGAYRGQALSVSRVRMARVPELALQAYVEQGECFGKAGAYAIQSQAAAWIEHMEGSYSGIMGLPLYECARLLEPLLGLPGHEAAALNKETETHA
jgi:septum formation protein